MAAKLEKKIDQLMDMLANLDGKFSNEIEAVKEKLDMHIKQIDLKVEGIFKKIEPMEKGIQFISDEL